MAAGRTGCGPCVTLGKRRSFNATGKYILLCSWAGPEAGLGSETLCAALEERRPRQGKEEEDALRSLAVQKTGRQRGRDRVVTGSLRTSP